MKLTIDRSSLLSAVTRVSGAAAVKSPQPYLSAVLLRCDGAKLTASATDLYVGIVHSVATMGAEPGALAVPAKDMIERVKAMPTGPVDVSVEDDVLTLRSGKRRHSLKGLSAAEYPPMPAMGAGHPVPVSSLASVFARTHFATSKDETRVSLSALWLEFGDTLKAVATDGNRLALSTAPLPPGPKDRTALVTARAVGELRKLTDGAAGDATVALADGTMFIRVGDTVFWTKLVAAEFVPYAQVMGDPPPRMMTLSRAVLLDAVRSTQVASDGRQTVRLDVEPGSLKFSAEATQGDAVDEFEVDTCGMRGKVGFNSAFMIDLLTASAADTVQFGIKGEFDPIWILPGEKDAPESTNLVMPLRLD